MPNTGERRFKRGQIICKPGEMDMNMYNILYGSVAVYKDYGTPEEVEVVAIIRAEAVRREIREVAEAVAVLLITLAMSRKFP